MISVEDDVIRVASLSTPFPKRIHLMDADGMILCGYNHLRFCLADAHPGVTILEGFIQTCTPCANTYNRMFRGEAFA